METAIIAHFLRIFLHAFRFEVFFQGRQQKSLCRCSPGGTFLHAVHKFPTLEGPLSLAAVHLLARVRLHRTDCDYGVSLESKTRGF